MCNESELNKEKKAEEFVHAHSENQTDEMLKTILKNKRYDIYDVEKKEEPLDAIEKEHPHDLNYLTKNEKRFADDWKVFYGIPKSEVDNRKAMNFVINKYAQKSELKKTYINYFDFTAKQGVMQHNPIDDVLPEKMGQIITASAKWKAEIDKNVFLSEREKTIRRVRAMRPYERYIRRYRELHPDPPMPDGYTEFYNEYDELERKKLQYLEPVDENMLDRKDKFHANLKSELLQREGIHYEKDRLDLKVQEEIPLEEDEQKEGVQAIDEWLVRNMSKTPGKCAFVSRILALPARERLFLYYIVSEKRRHDGTRLDISVSQYYVPSLDKFKKQMVASWVRVFKRIGGNHLYWDKLGDAFHILEKNRDEMDLFVIPGARAQRKREREYGNIARSEEAATPAEAKRIKDEYIKENRREQNILALMDALNHHRRLLLHDKENKQEIQRSSEIIQSAFEVLKHSEHEYVEKLKDQMKVEGEGLSHVKGTQILAEDMKVPGTAVSHTKGSTNIVMGVFEDYKATETKMAALPIANIISSVAVVTSLIGFLNSFINMCQTAGATSGSDRLIQAGELLGGLAALTKATNKTLEGMGKVMESLAPYTDTVGKVAKYAGHAVVGATIVLGAAKTTSYFRRNHHIKEAAKAFAAKPEDSREKRILRLSERRKSNKGKQALLTFGTAAAFGIAEFVVSSATLGAGIFFLTPILAGVAGKWWEKNGEIANEFLEQEFPIKEWLEKREEEFRNGIPPIIWGKKEKEMYRKQLLEEMAAMMGDASVDQMLTRAIRNNAEYLYEKMFYDDEGNFITHERYHSEEDLHKAVRPYKELIKSFGCSVKHGTSPKDSKPTLAVLIKKMKA